MDRRARSLEQKFDKSKEDIDLLAATGHFNSLKEPQEAAQITANPSPCSATYSDWPMASPLRTVSSLIRATFLEVIWVFWTGPTLNQ